MKRSILRAALFAGFALLAAWLATPLSAGEDKAKKLTLTDGSAKVNDMLTDKDARDKLRPQAFCKTYSIDFKAGQSYRIDMVRTDKEKDKFFDPYLRLEDASGKEVASDDDSGGFPNARIIYVAPKDGAYVISATTFGGGTGAYELTVKQMAAAKALALDLKAGEAMAMAELTKDDTNDKVRKSSAAKTYTIKLAKGKSYQIDMMSSQIDSFLRIEDTGGKQLADDDDGGDGLNARIVFNCPEDGEYRIIATTFAGGTGPFTLTVAEKK